MMHPHTKIAFISDTIGYGVVATRFIPAGTITWALDPLDKELTPEEVKTCMPEMRNIIETYSFRNNKGNFVLCWDHAKYVNHSFQSNCLSTAYDFEIAIQDIQVGEQLTDDYGYLNVIEAFVPEDEGCERKIVYPDDPVHYHKIWDATVKAVLPKLIQVEQALMPLIHTDTWEKIKSICEGNSPMDSTLKNYYTPVSQYV